MQKRIIDPSISGMLESLKEFNLGDIIRIKDAGLPIASFILATRLIDHLSRIRYYKYALNDAERFERFINDFFPHEYKGLGRNLYIYLRSTLVHNYSVKGKFYLEYQPSDRHLNLGSDGRTYLNIHNFVRDLAGSFSIFEQILLNDAGDARENAIAHNKEYPILSHKTI